MNNEHKYKKTLEQIANMNFDTGRADLLGLRIKEVVRETLHPYEPCPQCEGAGEVPNTSKWCVFEEEGPMTLKCLKFNKYVQNSYICRDCSDYTAKYLKMECPSCSGKKFTKVPLEKISDRFDILDL